MDILYTWNGFSAKKKAIIIGVFAFIVLAVVLTLCLTSGYKATTMRLLRMQGTVTLVTSSGSTKEPKGNMRFSSGDSLATGEDGLATIALDDDKIITLQSNSRAEFSKSRKKIEMTLTQGALYFNVTKPLEGDETFDIKTSTMIVGIRGTSGYIYVDRNGNPTVILTDGHVHVTGVNPSNGETKEADVYAGQRLSVFILSGTGETVVFSLDNIAPEDLPQGALDVIANNAALLERVCADTGWDPDYIKALAKGETEEEPTEPEETVATPTPTTAPDSTATPTPTPTPADEDDDDDDWDDDDWDPTPTPRTSGSDSGNSSSDDDDDNSGSGSGSATNTPTPRPTSGSATATPTPRPTSTSATATPTPRPSSATATPTPRPSNTSTPTPRPSNTPTPTPRPTPTNTPTPVPDTPTPIPDTPTPEPEPTPEGGDEPGGNDEPGGGDYIPGATDENGNPVSGN